MGKKAWNKKKRINQLDGRYMWGNAARSRFFAQHYPDHGRFNGNVIFKGRGFAMIHFARSGHDVESYSRDMCVNGKQEYFVGINSFSGCTTDQQHLFGLTNFYADFDSKELHGKTAGSGRITKAEYNKMCRLYDRILYLIEAEYPSDIPQPNTMVFTGRGFGFWWSLEQVSYRLLPLYEAVRNAIFQRFAQWLEEEGVTEITLDSGASHRPAGLARLPGSYNTTARCWGFFTEIHPRRIELPVVAAELGVGFVSDRANAALVEISGVSSSVAEKRRLSMLTQLRDIRVKNHTLKGSRDEMIYCYYNTLYAANGHDDEAALKATLEFASGFGSESLCENKIITYLSSSRRRHYKANDFDTINRVALTDWEAEQIGFQPVVKGEATVVRLSCRQAARMKQAAKQKRNNDILSDYRSGMPVAALAEKYELNRSTIYRLIHTAESETAAKETVTSHAQKEETNAPAKDDRITFTGQNIISLTPKATVQTVMALFCLADAEIEHFLKLWVESTHKKGHPNTKGNRTGKGSRKKSGKKEVVAKNNIEDILEPEKNPQVERTPLTKDPSMPIYSCSSSKSRQDAHPVRPYFTPTTCAEYKLAVIPEDHEVALLTGRV